MVFRRKRAEDAETFIARKETSKIRSVIFFILKIVGTVLLVGITTGVMFLCIFAFYVKTTIQSQLDITLEEYSNLEETSYLYYGASADGDLSEAIEWTPIMSTTQRTWVEYDEIPQYIKDAAVAIEDKRFYEHDGVDWYRTVGASYNMFFGDGGNFGGSTLTQQLIKNLTKESQVTVKRKIVEIFRALEIEKNYSKEEIITWYLNVIYLGQSSYGVQAAAQKYFDKDVGELSLAECACIIGITKAPTSFDPYNSEEKNKARQETILEAMYEQNYISYEEYKEAVNEKLNFVPKNEANEDGVPFVYTWYQETVISDVIQALQDESDLSLEAARRKVYNGGLRIYTCIDPDVQRAVDEVYTDLDKIPKAKGGEGQFQSAITVQDPETGYVLAISGGVGPKERNFMFNRATDATRPPGSSIKPLSVYGPALDTNVITTSSVYEDSPSNDIQKNWPKNDSGGWTYNRYNITTAVQKSVNTIAVKVLKELGLDTSYDYLENLGISTLVENRDGKSDKTYAPLALGEFTDGATVRDMTSAYCAIANGGVVTKSKTFFKVLNSKGDVELDNSTPDSHVVFMEETASTLTALLYNAVQNGTGTNAKLSSGMAAAGKTGTSGEKKDRWFCGFTPYYVAAVWTGYDKPASISVSGNPAAQLWNKVMTLIDEYKEHEIIKKFDTGVTLPKSETGSSSPSATTSSKSKATDDDDDEETTTSEGTAPSIPSSPDTSPVDSQPQESTQPIESAQPLTSEEQPVPSTDTPQVDANYY